jgi:hypothetical protein
MAFSLIGVVAASPLLILISIWIKLDSPGPVFYRGARVGLHGRLFRIYKFRTMAVNADRIGGPSTANDDPRITKVGLYLMRYKLVELPQLIFAPYRLGVVGWLLVTVPAFVMLIRPFGPAVRWSSWLARSRLLRMCLPRHPDGRAEKSN